MAIPLAHCFVLRGSTIQTSQVVGVLQDIGWNLRMSHPIALPCFATFLTLLYCSIKCKGEQKACIISTKSTTDFPVLEPFFPPGSKPQALYMKLSEWKGSVKENKRAKFFSPQNLHCLHKDFSVKVFRENGKKGKSHHHWFKYNLQLNLISVRNYFCWRLVQVVLS